MKRIEIMRITVSKVSVVIVIISEALTNIIEMICTTYRITVKYEEVLLRYLQIAAQEVDEARSYFTCIWELYRTMDSNVLVYVPVV
eukprot:snap_masked-scaffold_11-processed-gene-6.14-mRNA-1 protein AED:1.00 eAED:1.00 QI:0/0/0/0/1/1/2/0/85